MDSLKDLPEPYGFVAFTLRVLGGVGVAALTVFAVVESAVYLHEAVHPAAGYALGAVVCALAVGVSLLIERRGREVSGE